MCDLNDKAELVSSYSISGAARIYFKVLIVIIAVVDLTQFIQNLKVSTFDMLCPTYNNNNIWHCF